MNIKTWITAGFVLTLVGLISGSAVIAQPAMMPTHQSVISSKQVEFRAAMNKLWDDHVAWTRLYIVSAVAGLPDKDATAQRLIQNQTDIGNAIKPYYGDAAGDKLTALLKEHILIAAEIVDDAKSGDNTKMQDANQRWTANADEIAKFLSDANPQHWQLADMQKMMHEHLNLTAKELTSHLKADWTADIAAYDEVHTEILQMADMLASGIIDQYSSKF
jgi:adenine-specific DNA methylase